MHLRSAAALVFVLVARLACAQAASLGTTSSGPAVNGAYSAVAYDDKHDVFLHVWEDGGTMVGRFIRFDGNPAGASFAISGSSMTSAIRPRIAYTRGRLDDVFLVAFAAQDTGQSVRNVFVQRVRYTGLGTSGGVLAGSAVRVSPSAGTQDFSDVVFNPRERRFLVAWSDSGTTKTLNVQQMDPSGNALTAPAALATSDGSWVRLALAG